MKLFIQIILCITLMICFVGCGNAIQEPVYEPAKTNSESSTKETVDANSESEDVTPMKLYINNTEIPVIWEDNDSVREIMEEVTKGDIIVAMSMYSDNEQVGSLGRSYTSNNRQTTTHNGDIVLYNSSNIVAFYGSNSWSYTRLGKMDLSESEVTALLSNGDVEIKITR